MFSDTFQKDPLGARTPAGWTLADGRWDGLVADGGHVLRHAVGASYGHVVAGSPAWTDYTLSADVKATALDTGFAGVAGRYQDTGDYYECVIHHAVAVQLWRLRGGAGTLIDSRPVAVDTARFHQVRLILRGTQLSCMFDGVLLFTDADTSFRQGAVAVVASDGEAAEFGHVTVSAS